MSNRRTYVIADLHGRFDLLCKAIDLVEADAGEDGGTLIVLGDFVDRGPQSRTIIDLLMAGPQSRKWRWIVLQGNHEAIMLAALRDASKLPWWFGNGGLQTLASYGYQSGAHALPNIPAEHIAWLDSLPVYHEDDRRLYVHAGVPFDKAVSEVSRDTLQWMLYGGEDDDYYPDAEYGVDQPHISGKHIVHGHHQNARNPQPRIGRTNLDSFAWRTGRLAIGVFDDGQPEPIKIMDAIGLPFERQAT